MFLPMMRDRALSALAGTPDVLEALLGSLGLDDGRWDARPEADRFSLREIVAHLADYEDVWFDRLTRTQSEVCPMLSPVDPGELALKNDYAHSDSAAGIARFRDRRAQLVPFLGSLSEDGWQRIGQMGERGPLTLEEQVALVVIHDGYHTGRLARWLAAAPR